MKIWIVEAEHPDLVGIRRQLYCATKALADAHAARLLELIAVDWFEVRRDAIDEQNEDPDTFFDLPPITAENWEEVNEQMIVWDIDHEMFGDDDEPNWFVEVHEDNLETPE